MDVATLLHEPRFWYAVAFVLFFALFWRRLWRPLAELLDRRAAEVRLELDEAARLRREAEAMLADARRDREAALVEARTTVEHARAEASRIAEAAQRDAEQTARRRERLAQDRIAASQRAAVAEALSPDADAALVDRAISALPASFATRVPA